MNSAEQLIYKEILAGNAICTDSREAKKNSLFFALKGENFDGNKFAYDALKKGCKLAVIDDPQIKDRNKFILVKDVLKTIQNIAFFHRENFNIPFIGITGSNGKTTTKELINAVLSKKYKTYATKGNLNNHIGVPLTLLSIEDDTQVAIIEMGANHVGEIKNLCQMAKPNFGIITNIGKAHIGGFGSLDNIVKAKSELYDYIRQVEGKLFVNYDNELLMQISDKIPKITYGFSSSANCSGKIEPSVNFLKLSVIDKYLNIQKYNVDTNFIGDYNFENIMAAICVGSFFGIGNYDIKEAIDSYIPSDNRSQLIKTNNNTVLMDAYNANPSSMKPALENFSKMNFENKIVILGDMFELGKESIKEHKLIYDYLLKQQFDKIILVGKEFSSVAENRKNILCFTDNKQLSKYLEENILKNRTVFVKGSRGVQLEKVLDYI